MVQLFTTEDGSHSLLSDQFQVPYHSKYGAIQESNHVFLEAALAGSACPERKRTCIFWKLVLELG